LPLPEAALWMPKWVAWSQSALAGPKVMGLVLLI